MHGRALRTLLLLTTVSTLALPGVARAQTTATQTGTPEERAAAVVRPSVVYIEQYWKAWVRVPRSSQLYFEGYVNGGDPFTWGTRCSGFVVNPTGYIVTAGHCVDTSKEGARETALQFAVDWLIQNGWAYRRDFGYWLNEAHLAWGVEGTEKGTPPDLEVWVQRGVAAGGLKTGEAFPARVVDYQPWSQGDVAILKIEEADLPSVLVAPSAEIDIGTPVLSIGYPGSTDMVTDQTYEPTFKDGQINAQKTREGGLLPVYEMSAALSGGMSGGPTVSLDGAVVGVNSFNIRGETEAFNFITPSSLVAEMLSRNGVSNELGPIDEAYRAGLDAFFSGQYETAIGKFDEVLSLSPTHQQAQEFKVEATKLQAEAPKPKPAPAASAGFPTWAIAVITGGALVVVLGLFLALRRRRQAAAPAVATATPLAANGIGQTQQMPAPVGFQPAPSPAAATVAPPQAAGSGGMAPAPSPTVAPVPPAVPDATQDEHPRFCSSCGRALGTETRFCPSCGHPVGG